MGAFVTLIGFALGEWVLRFGPLIGLRNALQSFEVTLTSGEPATLPNALGINLWLVIIPLALLLGWWLLGEVPSMNAVIGAAIMLAGVVQVVV